MTSEEMEPDTDAPLLPLQGIRITPSTSTKTSPQQSPRRSQQNSPQKKDVTKLPVALRPAPQDATMTRRPPSTKKTGNDRSAVPMAARKLSTRKMPSPKMKPLLPVMERKSQEDKATVRRLRNNSDAERSDITPDGGSAGREGRQFTVGNVGNNGRIYLRPTVRPAHQRYPQPHFVFPMTPPQTAGLGATTNNKNKREDTLDISQLHGSQWTPSQIPSTPTTALPLQSLLLDDRRTSMAGHRRALSDSTIHGSTAARESDPGAFKIVVTQPGEEQRPKTVEDIDNKNPPHLEISIPSWKLGTPRFSVRGTPFIRGSSYAPTEEFRSSMHSRLDRSGGLTPRFRSSIASRRPGSFIVSPGRRRESQQSQPIDPAGPPSQHALRQTYMPPHIAIEPAMFDALTFKPTCDDRIVVRYSSTGAVTAATPPRLVAEITSPSFLDYELLSDFFLTFRAYLDPMDLLKMLFARMRWALARDDEVGMVVRVRTFVALRHWILNYFVEDFVCEYDMRKDFCNLLNSLIDDISQDSKGRRVQLKILAELKKCWRRVCAQFWDGPEFDASLPPEIPIAPGGIPGYRNPSFDPEFWQKYLDNGPPQLDDVLAPLASDLLDGETSFFRDVARAGGDEDHEVGIRPGTPENQINDRDAQLSPTSISSADVVSCSFPTRTLKFSSPGSTHPLAAHPVDPAPVYNNIEPVATTPRVLNGKRVRAQHSRKRSGSQSDSLREHSLSLEQLLQRNTETLLSLPYAGSLVRGNVLPPAQAFVEVASSTPGYGGKRQTTLFQPYLDDSQRDKGMASAMSGQGMRKLIGSVRRALSTRGQDVSPTQENFNIEPIGPRGVTTNRLPGTAIVPQARPRTNSSRPPVRIDLLGAGIVDDFKKVIREDAAAEAALRCYQGSIPSTSCTVKAPGEDAEFSAAGIDNGLRISQNDSSRPLSEGALTTGSKSIVIIDDTLQPPSEFPAMTGALPAFNPSVEAFAESFMPQGADPTPPNTPPGRTADTPRRSSHLLGHHMLYSARSVDALPPFVPDLNSLLGGSNPRPSEDMTRPSIDSRRPLSDTYRQSSSRPPLSMGRGHGRHRSSRSLRSIGTLGPRRYASFHSGMAPRSTVRSFDATTYSDRASLDQSSEVPVVQPLRLLRRRPGGDLRAVGNIGDLDHKPLRKSRSVGSLTTYTDSLRTSYFHSPGMVRDSVGLVDVVNSDYSRTRADAFSLGIIAEKPKRKISLLSTYSSKPIMRPSFEAEAQKLANIPDDDDDGGVESALLKLEGKYEKRSLRLSREPSNALLKGLDAISLKSPVSRQNPDLRAEKKKHRQEHIGEEGVMPPAPPAEDSPNLTQSSFLDVPGKGRSLRDDVGSFLSDGSSESYSSIPLLQRGLTDDDRMSRAEWTDRSVLKGPEEDGMSADERNGEDEHRSYEIVEKSRSIEKIKPGDTMPTTRERSNTGDSHQSFLNIDSDDDELSSELSDNPVSDEDDDDDLDIFPSLRRRATLTKVQTAASQQSPVVSQASRLERKPSPPNAIAQSPSLSNEAANVPELHSAQIWGPNKPLPPTPEYTPNFGQPGPTSNLKPSLDPTGVNEALRNAADMQEEEAKRKYSAHLPFILAFDSETLAQQFTLIEKDALDEIDWKELIEMQWKNAENNDCRSWVQFLRDTDARGVEVVIARFNIVVKWAISEIVLTQDIEERARCIIKYIHIAAHCRRYRNFATMSQIAVALTSIEIGRLTKTWKMVPAHDLRTLRELEALIGPTRNFYALRAEMEGGTLTTTETGCIPFVGIYTHDLIFNAQRPSEIASSPTTPPLVNFERCRIAAGVVKTLLRLLEASTRYNFQPIEGITERCLWMSALSDYEIRQHSEHLQ
ncbi:Guanine nucleotide exchange factor LTE1 [Cytospora mali]|uniref:Guanine nucleotide exchange factor LTE1 n=1 Tax=Cytospora mali TaxID=578113 RepID=A0A194VSF2_CYTMA|nr:Guanine nucleotide exchange factor LTE1 [Valsa mali]